MNDIFNIATDAQFTAYADDMSVFFAGTDGDTDGDVVTLVCSVFTFLLVLQFLWIPCFYLPRLSTAAAERTPREVGSLVKPHLGTFFPCLVCPYRTK